MTATREQAIKASMSIARDIAEGHLNPAELVQAVITEVRNLAGKVVGPPDPLWELQVDIARQVLAVGGGIGVDELAEWVAVYRAADDQPATPARSWIEQALAEGDDGDED